MNLETLDVAGCRGDVPEMEKRVWAEIRANRDKAKAGDTPVPDTKRTERLLEEAQKLREEAAKLRKKAAELEAKAAELERATEK